MSPCVSVCVCPKPFGPVFVPPQHHTQNSRHSFRKKLQHSGNVHQSIHGIWCPNDQDKVGHKNTHKEAEDTMYATQC